MSNQNNSHKTGNGFFHKSDFLKIGGTVIITLLAVYFFNMRDQHIYELVSPKTSLISTNEMSDLIKQYIDFRPLSLQYKNEEESDEFEIGKLQGFRFSAVYLDSILNHNRFLDSNDEPVKPDEVMFYLGQDGVFRRNIFSKSGNINLIAVGLRDGKLLIPSDSEDKADKYKASIYDKADPCPGPGCPPQPQSTPTTPGSGSESGKE